MLVEPDISPLAKRLAEENNVNWRGLLGSGAGGKIVERDVLEYLAKVMAGEEDINPTAEPLPEGMEAWPEDDVRSFYGGAVPEQADAPAAELENDLFVDTPDLGAFDAPATQQALQDPASLGEDIFLIEDEAPVQSAGFGAPGIGADPATDAFSEALNDTALADDGLGMDEIATFDDTDGEVFAAMSEDSFATDGDVEDLASLFVDSAEIVDSTESVDSIEIVDNYQEPAVVDQTVAFETPAEPDFNIPAYTAASSEDVIEAFATDNVDDVIASFEATAFEEENAFEEVDGLGDAFAETQDVVTPTFVVNEPAAEVHAPEVHAPEVHAPEVHATEAPIFEAPIIQTMPPAPSMPTFAEVVPVAAGVAGVGLVASALSATPAVSSVAQGNIPLVSYGVLLRRHVDLSTLMHAQQAVAEETGHEDISLASLLLRAAAKAQHKVPLVSGTSMGLAMIRSEGVSVAHIHDAASAPFRTVMSQAQQVLSTHRADSVDLAVADMSGFDIDEVVLNIGAPLLTLGRTMYDSSKGTHHSTLSLSGNVSVEGGTKFLSLVAELLNSPVRLVI
jgi:hypothetical protein